MTRNHDPLIYVFTNTLSVTVSVDTTEDNYVLTRAIVENHHPSSQPATATSSSSKYTQRTSSVIMSLDTTKYESVLTRATVDNTQPSYQPTSDH